MKYKYRVMLTVEVPRYAWIAYSKGMVDRNLSYFETYPHDSFRASYDRKTATRYPSVVWCVVPDEGPSENEFGPIVA